MIRNLNPVTKLQIYAEGRILATKKILSSLIPPESYSAQESYRSRGTQHRRTQSQENTLPGDPQKVDLKTVAQEGSRLGEIRPKRDVA